jgi:hypothetical protein
MEKPYSKSLVTHSLQSGNAIISPGGSAFTEYIYTAAVIPKPVIVPPHFCICTVYYYSKMLVGSFCSDDLTLCSDGREVYC